MPFCPSRRAVLWRRVAPVAPVAPLVSTATPPYILHATPYGGAGCASSGALGAAPTVSTPKFHPRAGPLGGWGAEPEGPEGPEGVAGLA